MSTGFYPTTASGTHYNTNRNSKGITRKGLEDAYKTMDRDGKKAEAWAQKIFRPDKSNVSNRNPTAGGGPEYTTGKERANHKYVKKVKTKSGKVRYIYDVQTASGNHRNTPANSKGITRKGLEDAYKTMDRDGKKAEAWAQKIFRPDKSSVSNQNPTAAGGNFINNIPREARKVKITSLWSR